MNTTNEQTNSEFLASIARRGDESLTNSQLRAGTWFLEEGRLVRRLITVAPAKYLSSSELLTAAGDLLHDCVALTRAVPQTKRQAPTRGLVVVGMSEHGYLHAHLVVDTEPDCWVFDAAAIGTPLQVSYDRKVGGRVTPTIYDSAKVLAYMLRQSYSDDFAAPQARKILRWTPSARGAARSRSRGNLSAQLDWLQRMRASQSIYQRLRLQSQVLDHEEAENALHAAQYSHRLALEHSTC